MWTAGTILFLSLALEGPLHPPDSQPRKPQGCEIGAEVPAFFVREVTGAQPNLAVCLVCRNGDRPGVLVAVRKADRQVKRLLSDLDRTIESHRAEGLRGFAIFIPADGTDLKDLPSRLTTLAHDRRLSLPLAIPVESTNGPAALKLPTEFNTTVLFYAQKKILASSHFKSGELTGSKIEELIESARVLASPKDAR